MANSPKSQVHDLAVFGGAALFANPKSTSSLVQPEFERFLHYSQRFFEVQQFSNNGPNVQLLETRLARFHAAKHCIAFCSGFWALTLTIKALALPGRTEVAMPSLTYRRMADIVAWVGLKPRFCEVGEQSLSLDKDTLAPSINSQTALIMAVHPIVNCCPVSEISELAQSHQVPLIFDGVESVYETVPRGKIGQFGDAECFSMHASKLLNGFEGGYVTTNDDALAERLRGMRTFGFSGLDYVAFADGMNAKLCEVHAAMALANLDRLDQTVYENRERYRCYQRAMPELKGLKLLEFDESQQTSYKNIIFEVTKELPISRDELVKILNAERILARAYYDPPLHKKIMQYPFVPASLPLTEELSKRFVSMPCGDFVTLEDIQEIANLLRFILVHAEDISLRMQLETEH